MAKGYKKFLFSWRTKWLDLFRESPTAAAVWDYMYWRSNEEDIFDLCEDLVCHDLKINPKTLSKARSTIERHHGFQRRTHYKDGQRIVTYRMLAFVQIPESGIQASTQKTVGRLDTEKRYHTVDTNSNGVPSSSTQETPIENPVNTNSKSSELVSELETASVANAPSPRRSVRIKTKEQHQQEFMREQTWLSAEDLFNSMWPNKTWTDEDIKLLIDLSREVGGDGTTLDGDTILKAWTWNQRHKQGKFRLYSLAELAKALRSDSDRSLLAQMNNHEECKLCSKDNDAESPRCVETIPAPQEAVIELQPAAWIHQCINCRKPTELDGYCRACVAYAAEQGTDLRHGYVDQIAAEAR